MTVRVSTCSPWATPADVCAPCANADIDQVLLTKMLQVASDWLFSMTGLVYPGECEDSVRPTARYSGDSGAWTRRFGAFPVVAWAGWSGGFCSCNVISDGCCSVPGVTLGQYPITGITQVKIDGVVVDPATYRIADDRWLVRLAPASTGINPGLPCCQRLDLPDTAVGTWRVDFTYGSAPPPGGNHAAAVLACELAMLSTPSLLGSCRLTRRMTAQTRQGVTVALADPKGLFADGQTGLAEVDSFLLSERERRVKKRASILSPDTMRRTHRLSGP